MTKHDFSDLTPPPELVAEWWAINCSPKVLAVKAARWGAKQAAERLKGQWPEPITDRPPTEADGDEIQHVQVRVGDGWVLWDWGTTADRGWAWRHTPNWQPTAPPTLKEQALKALDGLGTQPASTFRQLDPFTEELIRRALEAGS